MWTNHPRIKSTWAVWRLEVKNWNFVVVLASSTQLQSRSLIGHFTSLTRRKQLRFASASIFPRMNDRSSSFCPPKWRTKNYSNVIGPQVAWQRPPNVSKHAQLYWLLRWLTNTYQTYEAAHLHACANWAEYSTWDEEKTHVQRGQITFVTPICI